jgi:hypothetical protein
VVSVASLRYVNEAGDEERLAVGPDQPEVLIGRNKDCLLRTKNNTVSRAHAKVVWRDGEWFLVDLGSANGTFYQRKRVQKDVEVALTPGEGFFCGSFQVELVADPGDEALSLEPEPEPLPEPEPAPVPAPPTLKEVRSRPTATAAVADMSSTLGYDVDGPGDLPPIPPPPQPVRRGTSTGVKSTIGYDTASVRAAAEAVVRGRTEGYAGFKAPPQPPPPPEDDEVVSFGAPEPAPAPPPKPAPAKPKPAKAPTVAAPPSEIVRIATEAPDARKILADEKRREEDDARQAARIAELEKQVRERDDTIRKLGVQVDELGRVVARLEGEAHAEDESAVKVADLERVLASTEAEREGLEAALAEQKERLTAEAAQAAADRDRVASEALQVAEALERVTRERDALVEENERWDALKRQFEEERSRVQAEVEGLRRQVSEVTSQAAESQAAAAKAGETAAALKAVTDELAEVKTANRSYLKKVSRLLEENEKLKAAPPAPPPPPPAASPPAAAQDVVPEAVRQALDRVNELVSQARTSLDVVAGLVPELVAKLPEGPARDELGEQVRGAASDLAETVREVKAEILKARKAVER